MGGSHLQRDNLFTHPGILRAGVTVGAQALSLGEDE